MKWSHLPLEQFVDFNNGKSIKPSEKGIFPAFGSNGIIGYSDNYLYDKGIIIGRVGANCGSVEISLNNFWPSDNTIVVKPKPNADLVFVYYLLKNYPLNSYAGGSAQPLLTQTVLKPIIFKIPELPAQRRIASILSAYDDLIENNLKRIKLLEEKAFMRYKQIVREEQKTKKVPLSQLATVTSSKRIFLADYVEEGIPFYRSKEIITKSNFESIEKPLYITEERYSDIKEKFGVPVSGDLLITSVGTIGFVHMVNDDDGDFYFKDGNLIWIKNLLQQNLAYFLFFKFRTPEFKEMLNSVAIGSSQKALTIETVKKIEIEIPSDDSLIEFNQATKTIIKFIYNLQKQNTKLREARDILLPKLMNGQIEV